MPISTVILKFIKLIQPLIFLLSKVDSFGVGVLINFINYYFNFHKFIGIYQKNYYKIIFKNYFIKKDSKTILNKFFKIYLFQRQFFNETSSINFYQLNEMLKIGFKSIYIFKQLEKNKFSIPDVTITGLMILFTNLNSFNLPSFKFHLKFLLGVYFYFLLIKILN